MRRAIQFLPILGLVFCLLAKSSLAKGEQALLEVYPDMDPVSLQHQLTCYVAKNKAEDGVGFIHSLPILAFREHPVLVGSGSRGPLWCRIVLHNTTSYHLELALALALPTTSVNLFYSQQGKKPLTAIGISSPLNPSAAFGMRVSPGQSILYMRYLPLNYLYLSMNPIISEQKSYEQESILELIAIMVSQGVIWSLGLYYLLVGIAMRSASHIFYALANALLGLIILHDACYINLDYQEGYGYHMAWPELGRYLYYGSLFAFILFCLHFLELRQRMPRLTYALKKRSKALVVLMSLLLLCNLFLPPGARILPFFAMTVFLAGMAGFFVLVLVKGLIERHTMTYFLVAALVPPFILMFYFFFIPLFTGDILWSEGMIALTLGVSWEALILAISLAVKLNQDRKKVDRMDSILEATQTVQSALLPSSSEGGLHIHSPVIDIATYYSAAEHAGGDWFSFQYDAKGEGFMLQICDVTGHGIPAAIITGVITGAAHGCLEEFQSNTGFDPGHRLSEMAERINRILLKTGARVQCFATMSFIYINLKSGDGYVCGAGHPPLYIFGGSRPRPVICRGSVLGMGQSTSFGVERFKLMPGEGVFCYTDGLLENTNRAGVPLKIRQLKKVLSQEKVPEKIKDQLVLLSQGHQQGVPPGDDVSFVVARLNRYADGAC